MKIPHSRLIALTVLTAALIALLSFGMGGSTSAAYATPAPPQSAIPSVDPATIKSQALLRFWNAAPDSPSIDIYIDDEQDVDSLEFEESIDYEAISPGKHSIRITPTNQDTVTLFQGTIDLKVGTASTLVLEGLVSNKSLTALTYADDLSVNGGAATLSLVHGIIDAPNVDVVLSANNSDVPFSADLAFSHYQSRSDIPPGTYTLKVLPHGGTKALFTLPDLVLEPDTAYMIVLTGSQITPAADIHGYGLATRDVPGFKKPDALTK